MFNFSKSKISNQGGTKNPTLKVKTHLKYQSKNPLKTPKKQLKSKKNNKNKSKCVQRTLVAPLTVFYFSKYTKSLPHETMNDIE